MVELAVLYFYVLGGVLSGVGYYFLEHGEEEIITVLVIRAIFSCYVSPRIQKLKI